LSEKQASTFGSKRGWLEDRGVSKGRGCFSEIKDGPSFFGFTRAGASSLTEEKKKGESKPMAHG